MSTFRDLIKGERGQIAILFALLFMVILGLAAIVIDVGVLYAERRHAQNAADAAALAGARELPDDTCLVGDCLAKSVAQEYAAKNGFADGGDITVTTEVGSRYSDYTDSIEVTVTNNRTGIFLAHIPFGGDNFRTVSATAVAAVGILGEANAMPWGITLAGSGDCCVGGVPCDCDIGPCDGTLMGEDCVDPETNPGSLDFGFEFGVQYTIKLGPGAGGAGNFQCLGIDTLPPADENPGAETYRDTIANGGSQNRISVCQCVPNETGAMAGPTLDGECTLIGGVVQTLPGGTKICTGGDTHLVEEIVTPPCGGCFYKDLDEDGIYETSICAPDPVVFPEGCSDTEYTIHSHGDGIKCPRLVVVPIVKEYPSGASEDVVILGFSIFFIEKVVRDGNDADIWGYFVDSTLPGTWAPYQDAFGAKVVRLVE